MTSQDRSLEQSWPHAPLHRLSQSGAYFVTAGTYHKEHYFKGALRLAVLQRGLLRLTREAGWRLEAWAVFSNHYHFVAQSPSAGSGAESLQDVLQQLHRISATWVNRLDGTPSRRVWHNYWDSHLTFEKSYMARLHYVHENAAHHGLVSDARIYPYSSALWFENTASEATRRAIQSFKIDRISVVDGYDVHPDWQAG